MSDVWVNAPTMTRNTEKCTACGGPLPYTQFLLGEDACDPCPTAALATHASATPDGPRIGSAHVFLGRDRPRMIRVRDSAWARENLEVVHLLVRTDYIRSKKVPMFFHPLLRLLDEGVTPSQALTEAAREVAGVNQKVTPEEAERLEALQEQIEALYEQAVDEDDFDRLLASSGIKSQLPKHMLPEADPVVGFCCACARPVRQSEAVAPAEGVEVPPGEVETCDACLRVSRAAEAAGEPALHTVHPAAWDEHGIPDPQALRA